MSLAEASESIQHAITPGDCKDTYYPGKENSDLQCFPALQDNRFYVSLPSLNQGATNTIIFNPTQGLSDIVLTVSLPAPTTNATYAGWAFPRGWLAAMIDTMALRVGGSSLYYFTGDQMFIDTLTDCETGEKKQAVMNVAGAELLTDLDYDQPELLNASLYVKMPFNSISSLQKTIPLNTDLLSQPVQILITFKNFANVAYWYGAGNPNPGSLPSSFANAQVNFRQTTLQNSEHLLSRRENMNDKALTIPLRYFSQTTFRTNVTSDGLAANQINLTGFRFGSVKYIDVWARKIRNADNSPVPSGNPWNFVPFVNVQLLINGLVMYDTRSSNNVLWSLCDRKTPAQVNTTVLTTGGANEEAVPQASVMPWVVIPFAQLSEPMAYCNDLTLGYPIANSVLNLSVVMPEAGTYEISAAYHYAAALMASKGTMEYVF
jgi:hypothetical protein